MRDLKEIETDAFLARGELIGRLVAHPDWPAWCELLTTMRQASLEELARCSDPGDFRFWQGSVHTLAEILDRPARIVAEAAAYQRTEEEERQVIRPELRAAIGMGVDYEGDV